MSGCCRGLQEQFDERQARRDLRRFRRRGPTASTRELVRAIESTGVEGATLLDIGGGVGAIQHALLDAGATKTTDIDVSAAYVEAARAEGERRGAAERMSFRVGDFVELADEVEPADVVTLDRVICCYPDMEELVTASATRARRLYGLVYPRSGRIPRGVAWVANRLLALRSGFRVHIHESAAVDRLVRGLGFEPYHRGGGLVWQVHLYRRTTAGEATPAPSTPTP